MKLRQGTNGNKEHISLIIFRCAFSKGNRYDVAARSQFVHLRTRYVYTARAISDADVLG